MTPRPLSRSKHVLFAILTGVLVIVVLELLLWGLGLAYPKVEHVLRRTNHPAEALKPTIKIPVLGHTGNPALSDNDSRGFRNASEPARVDLVAIGDSQTYGTGVSRDHAWPHRLGDATGRSVYSMGFGGFGAGQHWFLSQDALALSPKQIVVGFYSGNDLSDGWAFVYNRSHLSELRSNDPATLQAIEEANSGSRIWAHWQRMRTQIEEVEKPWWRERARRGNRRSSRRVYSRVFGLASAFVRWIREPGGPLRKDRTDTPPELLDLILDHADDDLMLPFQRDGIRTTLTPSVYLSPLDLDDARIAEGLRVSLEIFSRMHATAQARDIAFLVLLIPTKELVFKELVQAEGGIIPEELEKLWQMERRMWKRIKSTLDSHGIAWVDSLPALRQSLTNGVNPYFTDWDSHVNVVGQQILADVVYKELEGR